MRAPLGLPITIDLAQVLLPMPSQVTIDQSADPLRPTALDARRAIRGRRDPSVERTRESLEWYVALPCGIESFRLPELTGSIAARSRATSQFSLGGEAL